LATSSCLSIANKQLSRCNPPGGVPPQKGGEIYLAASLEPASSVGTFAASLEPASGLLAVRSSYFTPAICFFCAASLAGTEPVGGVGGIFSEAGSALRPEVLGVTAGAPGLAVVVVAGAFFGSVGAVVVACACAIDPASPNTGRTRTRRRYKWFIGESSLNNASRDIAASEFASGVKGARIAHPSTRLCEFASHTTSESPLAVRPSPVLLLSYSSLPRQI
jgi:hypothetical protein